MSSKKLGLGGVLKLVAAVIGLVGVIVAVVCNGMGTAYAYSNFGEVAGLGALGVVLVAASAFVPAEKHVVATLAADLGIVGMSLAAIFAVSGRILMISGLFSWNSMNTAGWQCFYLTIATTACLLVASVIVIVASFMAPKTAKA